MDIHYSTIKLRKLCICKLNKSERLYSEITYDLFYVESEKKKKKKAKHSKQKVVDKFAVTE